MINLSVIDLLLAMIPVIFVLLVLVSWRLNISHTIYGITRMLIQLLLIGYVLVYIFSAEDYWPVLLVLVIMIVAASFIALRQLPPQYNKTGVFICALVATILTGGSVLLLVTQLVLELTPWYLPQYMIPLAGMIFSYAMNAISLATERLTSDLARGDDFTVARNVAFQAALIPTTNSLFAVGLVSLPGMMTGQILAGVSPFIAARYQIMVMCMLYGATGLSAAVYLVISRRYLLLPLSLIHI